MSTILRIGGLRVVIHSNDHRPAHVHVIGDSEAVFFLNCPNGPLELRESYGFRRPDLLRIQADLADHLNILCSEWRKRHGDY